MIIRGKDEDFSSFLARYSKVKDERIGEVMARHDFYISKSRRRKLKERRARRSLEK